HGNPVPLPSAPVFSVTSHGAVTVTSGGIVIAQHAGTDTVHASLPGATDALHVAIVAPFVTHIALLPKADTLTGIGATVHIASSFVDARGNNVPPEGWTIAWTSSNTAAA